MKSESALSNDIMGARRGGKAYEVWTEEAVAEGKTKRMDDMVRW